MRVEDRATLDETLSHLVAEAGSHGQA